MRSFPTAPAAVSAMLAVSGSAMIGIPGTTRPPKFPRLLRYVAVDEVCYDKLIFENAIPEERVRLLLSFVGTERFTARVSLPARPKRVLIFC